MFGSSKVGFGIFALLVIQVFVAEGRSSESFRASRSASAFREPRVSIFPGTRNWTLGNFFSSHFFHNTLFLCSCIFNLKHCIMFLLNILWRVTKAENSTEDDTYVLPFLLLSFISFNYFFSNISFIFNIIFSVSFYFSFKFIRKLHLKNN